MTTRSLHDLILHLRRTLRRPGDASLSDGQLLERWVGERDQAAFELLLWRHGPMVLNTCRRLLRRREDVEDVFQATFLVLVRKAGSIRRSEALAAWLHRVACRIALRSRAASARRGEREQPLVDVPADADTEEAATRDLRAILDEEIDCLPSRYRRAVVLCCLEGKSQEEAARLLACPRGTVSSWLTRGRERLRQRLLRRGVDLSVIGLAAALAPDAPAAALASLVAPLLRGVTAGGIGPVGVLSAQTIALAEGMLRTMLMTKVKIAAAVLLFGGLFAAGIGTLSHSTQAADPQTEPKETKKAAKDFSPPKFRGWKIEENDGIAWGKAAHGLQTGIAFRPGDQESYTVGESVTFVVYLRNVSKKTIRLTHLEELFAVFTPAVVEVEHDIRIVVGGGPINFRGVPMIHRTLRPGERITLGHPWFRIRPVDGWREKVLGPTCCALPGRYKVGYTGFSLRLNEDKEDMMIPATGQVELVIRQSDASKDNQPAKKSLDSRVPEKTKAPAIKAWGTSVGGDWDVGSKPVFLNVTDFEVGIRIDPKHRHSLRKVTLLASRDRGATFSEISRARPDDRAFRVRVPSEGVYHFVIQTEDEEGRVTPHDPASVRPALAVCVDMTQPEVEFDARRTGKDTIRFEWDTHDENLDPSSVRCEYLGMNVWKGIPIPPTQRGRYDWTIPSDYNGFERLTVRLRVRDKAGNSAEIQTQIFPEEKRP
jgi:RNA polymerase sigma factor (sigma-70 family)